jgi:hypothetical protein
MSDKPQHNYGNMPPFDPDNIIDLENLALQLRATYNHLFLEAEQHISNANKWKDNHPNGVVDDGDQADATDRLAQLYTLVDAYHGKPNSAHTVAKAPFLQGGRIVDQVMNAELAGSVRTAAALLAGPMKAYADAKVRRLRQEVVDNAKRIADEAMAAYRAELHATVAGAEDVMQAEQNAIDASAEAQNIAASSLSKSRGDTGSLSGLRGKWRARIVDGNKIPKLYLAPNWPMIEAAGKLKDKTTGRPLVVIPGIEWYEETTLSVRRSP